MPSDTPDRPEPSTAPLSSSRARGLWAEIALALALLTLASVVLNAGVLWVIFEGQATDRQSEIALSLGRTIRAQLEGAGDEQAEWRRTLASYRRSSLEVRGLWVISPDQELAVKGIGSPEEGASDRALRAALYSREESVEVRGLSVDERSVIVTEPLVVGGAVVGALQLEVPAGGALFGGRLPFFLLYTVGSVLLISGFGYSLLRQRLIAPVLRLQRGTQRIASGEFGHRVEADGPRELEAFSEALNQMSGALSDYRGRTEEQVRRLEAANQELRRVQEELIRSEKMASLGRLAAGIAHEMGNPLAVVLGYNELLRAGLGDPTLEQDLLDRTNRELERIQSIIRDLLDFARPGSVEREIIPARALLEDAVETVQHQPALRGVAFVIELPPTLPALLAVRERAHQILLNLFLNAGSAMGGQGRILLWAEARGDEILLHCQDDGPGFAPEVLPQIFDPFFTTKEPGEGTGLGLSISLHMAEDMGGALQARNAPGGGGLLTLSLPVAEEA